MPDNGATQPPVAIVGVAALMPGTDDVDSFWATDCVTAFHNAVGRLAVHGVHVDLAALRPHRRPAPPPAVAGRPRLTMTVTGASYARPYPPAGGAAGLDRRPHSLRGELA
jgi:acyl transferase domain-containing protein